MPYKEYIEGFRAGTRWGMQLGRLQGILSVTLGRIFLVSFILGMVVCNILRSVVK